MLEFKKEMSAELHPRSYTLEFKNGMGSADVTNVHPGLPSTSNLILANPLTALLLLQPSKVCVTPALLYAGIPKPNELQPHPYTLDFKNAKQDGRDARTPTRCPQSYMLEFGNGANPTRTPRC